MANPTTFKLLRAVSGRCNFAETTVVLQPHGDGDRIGVSPELYLTDDAYWISDAIRGVAAALDSHAATSDGAVISAIRTTIVDSTHDNVAVSAYVATCHALGVDATVDDFIADGYISFPPLVR